MKISRRNALSLTAAATAASLVSPMPAFAADGDQFNAADLLDQEFWSDRFMGAEDAPVTVVEYASSTCPHCAAFHAQTYPAFKEQYVETGKVRFVLRPFLLNILDAVVFMLADAAGDDGYYPLLDTYFAQQQTWSRSETPRDAILKIALELGFTEESFEAALTNQELFTGMEQLREQASTQFDLTGTPTFYVNGKQLSGAKTIEQLAAEIDPLLG